jgi:2-methylisocitrate lyase-like PEP mutase family enzyme
MTPAIMTVELLSEKATALRALHHGERPLVLANAWDAASARLVAEAGYPAVATTSAGIAYALGYADGERVSRKEMLQVVRRIAAAVSVPVSADLEAGYGAGPEAVARTTRDLVAAGAVGLNLEDARGKARRKLLPATAQVERVRAVRETGRAIGVPVVINARTDAFHFLKSSRAIEEAVERGNAYLGAGADCVFVPFVREPEIIGELVRGIHGPVNILAGPGTPTVDELAALGVRRVSVGSAPMRATLGLARRIARDLRERGTCELIQEWALPYEELQQLFGGQAP